MRLVQLENCSRREFDSGLGLGYLFTTALNASLLYEAADLASGSCEIESQGISRYNRGNDIFAQVICSHLWQFGRCQVPLCKPQFKIIKRGLCRSPVMKSLHD